MKTGKVHSYSLLGKSLISRFLTLIYVLRHCIFELVGIKKIVKRDPKSITEKFNGNNSWIMAVAINNIFESCGWNTRLPGQRIDIVAMCRAELLNAQRYQFPCIHPHTPVHIKSISVYLFGTGKTDFIWTFRCGRCIIAKPTENGAQRISIFTTKRKVERLWFTPRM